MKKSSYFPVFLSAFIIFVTALAFAVLQCPKSDANDNWMATSFVLPDDAPENEIDLSLTSPQLARLKNTEFNSSLLKRAYTQAVNESSILSAMSYPNISLKYIRAIPNPVNSGSAVTLTALFGNASLNTARNPFEGTNRSLMMVNVTIKDSSGAEVGKADLKYLSDGNYLGIWKANLTRGVYDVSVDTLASGNLSTFADALQVKVI
jgi:hypothetical protein